MATLVMQSLGCDVSAINTVHYSQSACFSRLQLLHRGSINVRVGNHTAYKQVKGSKTSADQILELYEGLRQSSLNNFDLLLTGYMPSAECVQAVGKIGRDIKFNAGTKPGSFFWGESGETSGQGGQDAD
jgi:pyridoxine kinase